MSKPIGNAFTVVPKVVVDTRKPRSIKQILAPQKGGIVIGKPADSDKRAGFSKAAI